MAHLFSSLLLSLASNVDNFAVGIAYGVKRLRISLLSNLLIALISGVGTLLSMSVGDVISSYLPNPVANGLGSAVLVAIGLWGIWETWKIEKKRKRKAALRSREISRSPVAAGSYQFASEGYSGEVGYSQPRSGLEEFAYEGFVDRPEKADTDRSGHIGPKEAIALSFGLAINNLSSGVGAGISNLNVTLTAILTFAVSALAIAVGFVLGKRFSAKMTGLWPGMVSGLLIVLLGLYEYLIP
ncbi:MAG: manganese efflux pump [Aphanocapsa sp. GSE-SYN-MK-11-07L]|nr:manganese efflux pump [Aphanocapsa sp. GSE-SYN-MK-11-07L]